MKKNLLHLAYVGAIALVGSVCFSACSDDKDDPGSGSSQGTEVSKNVGGVPVNFVFNVSTAPATTRMNADAVQATGTSFRGINKARLAAFKLSADGKIVTNPGDGTSSTEKPEKIFAEFTSLMSAVESGYDNTANSHRVLELTLPQGANTMLFYGTAPNGGNYRQHGKIDHTHGTDEIKDMMLSYSQRISGTDYNRFKQVGSVIAAIMTGFADMGFKSNALDTKDRDLYFWWDTTTDKPEDALVVGWRPSTTLSMAGTANSFKDYELFYKSSQRTTTTPSPEEWVAQHMTSGTLDAEETTTMKNTRTGTDTSTTPETGNVSGHVYKLYRSDVTWKAYGLWAKGTDTSAASSTEDQYPNEASLSALGTILGNAYNSFISKDPKELRAASSDATLYTVKDLYQVIEKVEKALPTTMKEFVATEFAKRLAERIREYFTFDTSGNISWNSISGETGVLKKIYDFAHAAGNDIAINLISTQAQLTGFPTAYNIPPGASLLDFTYNYGTTASPNNKDANVNYGGLFRFLINIPNYDLGGSGDGTTYVTQENYVFPAELMYFGNSPIRVTDTELSSSQYPDGSANWINDESWGSNGWSNGAGHVKPDTKSVAMMYNINYGVALLETKVKITPNESNVIYDNADHFYHGGNKAISITDTSVPFILKGIIIGGQPQKVGWNYTATVLSEMDNMQNWDRLVYDDVIINGNVTKTSGSNVAAYTLLLDNYSKGFDTSGVAQDGAQDKQGEVYVALEFENKAGNFMGQHNMVRNNGTFYLIGKVDPKAVDGSTTKKYYETVGARDAKDKHVIPPYKADGTSEGIARVFMQDYKTSITFTIGENSLKYAYVTVPNLSTSQVSLGLSVDVKWETGIDFGEVLLGGN